MPNHVRNRLKLSGDPADIARFLSSMKTAEREFDFNVPVPMPASLDITAGSAEKTCLERYIRAADPANSNISVPGIPKIPAGDVDKLVDYWDSKNSSIPLDKAVMSDNATPVSLNAPASGPCELDDIRNGAVYASNILRYGHATWYDWCCEHWNTKWNAYDIYIDRAGTVWFSTAWSPPLPVVLAAAAMFPKVSIVYDWADEDTGCNTGHAEYAGGSCASMGYYKDCSKEAYEACFDVWNADPASWGYVYDPIRGTYVYDEDGPALGIFPAIRRYAAILARGGARIAVSKRIDPDNERNLIRWIARLR